MVHVHTYQSLLLVLQLGRASSRKVAAMYGPVQCSAGQGRAGQGRARIHEISSRKRRDQSLLCAHVDLPSSMWWNNCPSAALQHRGYLQF